jgi:hypothetical protein
VSLTPTVCEAVELVVVSTAASTVVLAVGLVVVLAEELIEERRHRREVLSALDLKKKGVLVGMLYLEATSLSWSC